MKSIELGTKDQLCKRFSAATFIRRNCKLELSIVIALGVLWGVLSWRAPGAGQVLKDYFNESRCSGIVGFASVVIGIYITVWSIFATSASKMNAELLKNKVEGQLFFLIAMGLAESFLVISLCVFVPSEVPNYVELMALLTVLAFVSFAKLVILIMRITKLNIKYIVQEIDAQNVKCTEAQVKLDEIYQRAVNEKK